MYIVRRKVCINFDTKVNKQKLSINFLDAQKSSGINLYLELRQQCLQTVWLNNKSRWFCAAGNASSACKNKYKSIFIENKLQ